jgi:hypothetical protein
MTEYFLFGNGSASTAGIAVFIEKFYHIPDYGLHHPEDIWAAVGDS